ncbi:MAG TPA: hypothetical protein VIA62_15050 [Thermoanaerobaculia bacterium]|jgi:hypothetical protein|nr:hypothetical protein [Thermoanaerobaculia bacterium]
MKKRMERLDDKLFQPLTATQQKRITAGFTPVTETPITLQLTYGEVDDYIRDGDNE